MNRHISFNLVKILKEHFKVAGHLCELPDKVVSYRNNMDRWLVNLKFALNKRFHIYNCWNPNRKGKLGRFVSGSQNFSQRLICNSLVIITCRSIPSICINPTVLKMKRKGFFLY